MSRKWRIAVALAAAGLLLIGAEVWIETLAVDRSLKHVETKLAAATGLEVRVGRDFHLEILPVLRFEAQGLTVVHPERPSKPMLQAEVLRLDLDPWRLLRGAVVIEELELERAVLNLEGASLEAAGLERAAPAENLLADDADRQGSPFEIQGLRVEDLQVFHRAATGVVTSVEVAKFALLAEGPDNLVTIEVRGRFEGSAFEIEGKVGSVRALVEREGPFPVVLTGRMGEAKVELNGSVEVPDQLRGIDAHVSIELPDLADLYPVSVRDFPPIGPVVIEGRLRNPEGVLAIEALRVSTRGDPHLQLEVTGSIRDLFAMQGTELDVALEGDELSFLRSLASRPLPDIDSIRVEAHLSDRDRSLGAEGSVRAAAAGGQLTVEISGEDDDLDRFDEIDVRLVATARDLELIQEVLSLPIALPALGPAHLEARLRGRPGTLAAEEIRLRVGAREAAWVEVDGEIGDLAGFEQVHLVATFGAPDLRHVQPYLERDAPKIGPLGGGVTLSDRDGSLGLEDWSVQGGHPDTAVIELSGGIDRLSDLDQIELHVNLELKHLEIAGALLGVDLPAQGPVSFRGDVIGSDGRVTANGRLKLGQSVLDGEATGSFLSGARPNLKAKIRSAHIRLQDVGIEPHAEPPRRLDEGEYARSGWSGEAPFPLEKLRALDADVVLHSDRVTGRGGLDLQPLRIVIRLDGGRLEVLEFSAGFESGRITARAHVDANTSVVALNVEADEIDLTRLLAQWKEEPDAGILDASMDLNSRGRTPNEIRSNLEGGFRVVTREGSLASRYGKMFVTDLAGVSLPALRLPRAPRIGCMVGDFEIEAGIASVRNLYLDSEKIEVVGSGTIDIGRDAFELKLEPRAKEPGLISLAAVVDVSGPIAAPVFNPRFRSVPVNVVRGLVSNAIAPGRALIQTFSRRATQLCEEASRPGGQS